MNALKTFESLIRKRQDKRRQHGVDFPIRKNMHSQSQVRQAHTQAQLDTIFYLYSMMQSHVDLCYEYQVHVQLQHKRIVFDIFDKILVFT